MRTYLYVDGENFATRARRRDEEVKSDPSIRNELERRLLLWYRHHFPHAAKEELGRWHSGRYDSWSPRPHREAFHDAREKGGILHCCDEVYWDVVGMYLALGVNLMIGNDELFDLIAIDRAYYYAGVSGKRIEQHRRDLHSIGFAPYVFPKAKPDSFAKQMSAEGITVISRPKPMDILIATQVLDDCAANNFDRCIFVGGDEDYVPLLDSVRRRGKQVWLVAIERWLGKDQKLRFACDRFVAYDPVLAGC